MTNFTSLIWFRRLFVLGSVVAVAAAAASGASASGNTPSGAAPDVFERYAASHPYSSAVMANVLERYAAAHPYGRASVAPAVGTDRIVDDWFRDPTPIVTSAGERIVDDSFRDAVRATALPSTGDSLDWADFGIGAGAMLGLTMLMAGLGLGALTLRHRSGRLGTS
jgi:hypothetical protein